MNLNITGTVHLIYIVDNKVLMLKRKNTSFFPGYWCFPGGGLDNGEDFKEGIIREAKEEIGLNLKKSEIEEFKVLFQIRENLTIISGVGIISKPGYEYYNAEPEYCSEIKRFDLDNLPDNTLPYITHTIDLILNGPDYIEVDLSGKF